MGKLLEVCVDSVESAKAAIAGGADRLELCSNLIIGGTTPSLALYKEIRKISDIPIHVLIRPRFGDFCYSDYEVSIIKEEISEFQKLGADGIVIGILSSDGSIDEKRMAYVMQDTHAMSVTLHRAFDMCKDPFEAVDVARQLGIHTILTSGQKNICTDGIELLNELHKYGKNIIDIMAGSGVNAKVIRQLLQETELTSFHMSGKKVVNSKMIYRNEKVSMGLPVASEYDIWQTDESSIREAKEELLKSDR